MTMKEIAYCEFDISSKMKINFIWSRLIPPFDDCEYADAYSCRTATGYEILWLNDVVAHVPRSEAKRSTEHADPQPNTEIHSAWVHDSGD